MFTLSIKNKEIMALGIVLFVIATVASLLLVTANLVTKPKIDALAAEMENAARKSVLPAADSFEPLEYSETTAKSVYTGYTDQSAVGYCINVSPKGFGGSINMLVGISVDGSITGIKILQAAETPGLGSKAERPEFTDRYLSKAGPFEVTTKPNPQDNQISAISGATITSSAVTDGVNMAVEVFKTLKEVNDVSDGAPDDTLDE